MTEQVRIFDTTLRDGEQAPGFSMGEEAKLKMARALAALRVDIIEAGFAAASPGDARAVERIAAEVGTGADSPTICSLSRAIEGDIRASAKALMPATNRRIHVFLGTSPLHREFKLKMDRAEVLERIRTMVGLARDLCEDVEFSAEDAIRTERDFLVEALSVAAEAGATTLNVPDTVGYSTPEEILALFQYLGEHVTRPGDVIFSTHCHDDLGMAVANSLAAVRGGARQIECAVNGIGERAGNCALEDAVMALRTRRDSYGLTTGIDTTHIMQASRTLSRITNTHPPRNKAVVGANAFAHESGIHQHGVLAKRETYEIMKPEDVGLSSNQIVLGKHSGKHALADRARSLGWTLDSDMLERAFIAFKELADEIGQVDEGQLSALLERLDGTGGEHELWRLSRLEIRAPVARDAHPVARIELEHGRRGRITEIASAPGTLDAIYLAVSQIMDCPARVEDIDMQYVAAEPEADADGEQHAQVLVELRASVEGRTFAGRARDRDIIPACVGAYIDALNNAAAVQRRRRAQPRSAA